LLWAKRPEKGDHSRGTAFRATVCSLLQHSQLLLLLKSFGALYVPLKTHRGSMHVCPYIAANIVIMKLMNGETS
ncbi:MAG: hypothetical protein DMG67_15005, partial [Acidobacteria bacterium]